MPFPPPTDTMAGRMQTFALNWSLDSKDKPCLNNFIDLKCNHNDSSCRGAHRVTASASPAALRGLLL